MAVSLLSAPVDYTAFCVSATVLILGSIGLDWAAKLVKFMLQRNDMQHVVRLSSAHSLPPRFHRMCAALRAARARTRAAV